MHPVFDIDDLEFLRINGLALRHVEYEKGLCEQENGSERGDAVSLANYGLNKKYNCRQSDISQEDCLRLQKEIENFIFQSFKNFHNPYHRYTDAAFHLMERGDDARMPYDFASYPLGKCGTKAFVADQIVFSIFTNTYQNEDIIHATMQTFLEFKDQLRQLKIQKVNEWILLAKQNETKDSNNIVAFLSQLLYIYSENIYLEQAVFPMIERFFSQSSFTLESIDGIAKYLLSVSGEKKGENTLVYAYEEEQWDEFDELTLKEKLLHYIKNQNLSKVETCLSRLDKKSFAILDLDRGCPLQFAASFQSTEILKTVYEFYPERYGLFLVHENFATPIYCSFQTNQYENTLYLLSQRQLHFRDLSFNDGHILACQPNKYTESYFEVVKSLLKWSADIGNEHEGLFKNPLAVCIRNCGYSELDDGIKLLQHFLPLANYHSKYQGLLACSLELYYVYGQSTHYVESDSPYATLFRDFRQTILESLSTEECVEINCLVREKKYAGNAEITLYNDLSQTDLSSDQLEKLRLCFAHFAKEVEKENYQVTNPQRLWQPAKALDTSSKNWTFPCAII